MGSFFSQSFPPKPQFTPKDIPDLTGKVAIVTGANTGIGKETAKELLAHGAKVYVAARSRSKTEAAIAEIKTITGKEDAHFLELDLSDLVSVKRAAETIISQEKAIHILIANAGVMTPPMDQLSAQGLDLQFGTNVLGHWYLIQKLLPVLREAGGARVAILSSIVAGWVSKINWDAFEDTPARRKLGPQGLYAQSKIFAVIIAREFARRYADSGIIFSSLNPGNIRSDLQRHMTWFERFAMDPMLFHVSYGAISSLYATTSPDATTNAAYYIPWARLGKTPKAAQDDSAGPRFWAWAEKQVKDI